MKPERFTVTQQNDEMTSLLDDLVPGSRMSNETSLT